MEDTRHSLQGLRRKELIVPPGSTRTSESLLNDLSINYHGDLRLRSDRINIISHGKDVEEYHTKLREAIDRAVSIVPDLVILIMGSMLKSQNVEGPIKTIVARLCS